jgi:flagellar hook-associated protein 3 FlgL
MRISTAQMYQASLNAMLDNQSSVTKTQLQLSTGRRILTPADDPAGAAEALDLTQLIEATRQFQRNADSARSRLELEEGTLGNISDILQRVRELAVQGNNDSQTRETRRYMAVEVRELLDQMLDLANTRDANGEYLFAGHRGTVQPFTRTAGGQYLYSGDAGQRFLQIGPGQQVADGDSGLDTFLDIRNGNGTFTTLDNPANTGTGIIDPGTVTNPAAWVADDYRIVFTSATTYDVIDDTTATTLLAAQTYVDGAAISFNGVQTFITGQPASGDQFTLTPSVSQDIFTTVQNLAVALETGTAGAGSPLIGFHNAMNRVLMDLDQGMENIVETRARAGGRLNAIDSQKNANSAFLLQAQTTLSEVQDLDIAEAASRLQRQLLSLEAAQQTFVKVQGLSLFNFLR